MHTEVEKSIIITHYDTLIVENNDPVRDPLLLRDYMDKWEGPSFLYHGSQYKLDIIKPQKASGKNDKESLFAIYASKNKIQVIPFALPIRWYPDNPNGKRDFICNNGYTHIEYGSINPNGVGYIYKLPADKFVQLDDWQWISTFEVKPIEILEIKVNDYWNMITFSKEAIDIEKKLYKIEEVGCVV